MSEDGLPKDCEALVDGEWLPATLLSWHRWPDGSWRGAIVFRRWMTLDELNSPFSGGGSTAFWFNFERSCPADQLRPPTGLVSTLASCDDGPPLAGRAPLDPPLG
jgi:hypothetical protein